MHLSYVLYDSLQRKGCRLCMPWRPLNFSHCVGDSVPKPRHFPWMWSQRKCRCKTFSTTSQALPFQFTTRLWRAAFVVSQRIILPAPLTLCCLLKTKRRFLFLSPRPTMEGRGMSQLKHILAFSMNDFSQESQLNPSPRWKKSHWESVNGGRAFREAIILFLFWSLFPTFLLSSNQNLEAMQKEWNPRQIFYSSQNIYFRI